MVYDDAEIAYAKIAEIGKRLLKEAFEALSPKSTSIALGILAPLPSAFEGANPSLNGGKIVGYSSLDRPRREVVKVPLVGAGVGAARLKSEAVQISKDGKSAYLLMDGGVNASAISGVHMTAPRGLYADVIPVCGTCFAEVYCVSSTTKSRSYNGRKRLILLDEFKYGVNHLEWEDHQSSGCRPKVGVADCAAVFRI
jgi:hypothetical protein